MFKLYLANSFEKLKALAKQLSGYFFPGVELLTTKSSSLLDEPIVDHGTSTSREEPQETETCIGKIILGLLLLLSLQLMISNQVDQCLVQIVFITAMLFPYRYCWVERSDHCCLAMVFRQKDHYRQGLSP